MASKKPPCKYGKKCYRKNTDHLRNFSHPQKSDDEEDISKDQEDEQGQGKKRTTLRTRVSTDCDQEQIEKDLGMKKKPPPADGETSPKRRKTDKDESESSKDENEDKAVEENEESSLNEDDPPASPEDVKENIKMKFLVEMPEDFYHFWDLCNALNPADPLNALKCLKLKLAGPFDILAGKHKKVIKNKRGRRPNFLLHYRYYYDPPEFQTVLVSKADDKLHFGYFRDDPNENPVFVASNSPGSTSSKEKISPCGENLFAAVHLHALKLVKSSTPFEKTAIQKMLKSIEGAASKHGLDLTASTKDMKQRQKKVVCPSFHGAGIVVPVDDNEIGYRPVPETPGDLKAMFRKISEAKTDDARDRHLEELQELITLIQFANDECDYGEGLELGMDLFSFGGSVFHPQISILLPLAYQLLNRREFASIITAHLDRRRRVEECVDELAL